MALSERTATAASNLPRDGADADALSTRILRLGVIVAIASAVLQVASQAVNYFVFDGDVWALNVDGDDNSFAWASSVAQFAAAFCFAMLALTGWWSARRLLALALILAYFSLDDIARIHEQASAAFVDDVLGAKEAYGRLLWPLIFFPLLAGAFVLLWRFAERASAQAERLVKIALFLLVAAVVAEAFSTVFHLDEDAGVTFADTAEVAVEESLELAAWILIAAAAAATLFVGIVERGRRSA